MIYFIAAVRDTAIDCYQGAVHLVRAKGEAMRNFADAVNDQRNQQLYAHAEDFELWILGTFNDADGSIESKPERLARGQDVKRTNQ